MPPKEPIPEHYRLRLAQHDAGIRQPLAPPGPRGLTAADPAAAPPAAAPAAAAAPFAAAAAAAPPDAPAAAAAPFAAAAAAAPPDAAGAAAAPQTQSTADSAAALPPLRATPSVSRRRPHSIRQRQGEPQEEPLVLEVWCGKGHWLLAGRYDLTQSECFWGHEYRQRQRGSPRRPRTLLKLARDGPNRPEWVFEMSGGRRVYGRHERGAMPQNVLCWVDDRDQNVDLVIEIPTLDEGARQLGARPLTPEVPEAIKLQHGGGFRTPQPRGPQGSPGSGDKLVLDGSSPSGPSGDSRDATPLKRPAAAAQSPQFSLGPAAEPAPPPQGGGGAALSPLMPLRPPPQSGRGQPLMPLRPPPRSGQGQPLDSGAPRVHRDPSAPVQAGQQPQAAQSPSSHTRTEPQLESGRIAQLDAGLEAASGLGASGGSGRAHPSAASQGPVSPVDNAIKALQEIDREEWESAAADAPSCRSRSSCVCGCLYLIFPAVIVVLLLSLAGVLAVAVNNEAAIQRRPSNVTISGRNVYVNGAPFIVKGVAYSPVWKGQDAGRKWPYGDHMFEPRVSVRQVIANGFGLGTNDFESFDDFHLARIKAAGFNTIRMYNWLLDKDHSRFLDSCKKHSLMVILTFWMDSSLYGPLSDVDQQHKAKVNFAHMLRRYKDHPQILMWAFGNEVNLASNAKSYHGQMPEFFSLCDSLREIRDKEEGGFAHPIVIPIAATSDINDLLKKYDLATGFDLWGLQPYMSPSVLNDFLLNLHAEKKPVLITEYGMDSLYDDIRRRRLSGLTQHTASAADEHSQMGEMTNLTRILFKFLAGKTGFPICMPGQHSCEKNHSVSVHALPWPETVFDDEPVNEGHVTETGYQEISFKERGNPRRHLGRVIDDWRDETSNLQHDRYNRIAGMVVFEWMDEWWKGPRNDPDHPDCDQDNEYRQSSCGFLKLDYGQDGRQNEEHFGITAQDASAADAESVCLRPKPLFYTSQVFFGNAANLQRAVPFCPDCTGAEGRCEHAVDASYLSRLRVAAAPGTEDQEREEAYGTLRIPKDAATVATWSVGDVHDTARDNPSGTVTIADYAPRLMRVSWYLTGLRGSAGSAAPNGSCAVRIHRAKSCSVGALASAHLFRGGPDPWPSVQNLSSGGCASEGSVTLDIGLRIPTLIGHAVVVYSASGQPAACGVLDSAPGWAPARAGAMRLRRVTGYRGAEISGAVYVTDVTEKPTRYRASFRGAHADLTMKVLSGGDCYSPGQPLYFERDQPWSTTAPTAASIAATHTTAVFDNGYALADLFGRVAAFYKGADMVACAVIRRRSQLEGYAEFGNAFPGGSWLDGTAELYDETRRELHIDWDMRSLASDCPGPAPRHELACTIGLRSIVGQNKPVAGVTYTSNTSGASRGSMITGAYRKAIGDLDGVTVDFRDQQGRVNARGHIAVEMDEVTVKYDGYTEAVERTCCIKAPPLTSKLLRLFEESLGYVLLVLGVVLGTAVLVLIVYRLILWNPLQPSPHGKRAHDSLGVQTGHERAAGVGEAGGPDAVSVKGSFRSREFSYVRKYLAKDTDVSAMLRVMEIAFCNPQIRPVALRRLQDGSSGGLFPDEAKYDATPAYEALVSAIGNAAMRMRRSGDAVTTADVADACKRVYEATIPKKWQPQVPRAATGKKSDPSGCCSSKLATDLLLFLVVQQRIDGLRQCRWFKTTAFNYIVEAGKDRAHAMQHVAVVAQHHLKYVESRLVNYADIDDTYKAIFNGSVNNCLLQWPIVFNRRCHAGPRLQTFGAMVEHVRKGRALVKTFPERISWFVPLRLFSFTFHSHIVLYYVAVAMNLRLPFSTTVRMLGEAEVIFCFLNLCIDLWMFPLPEFGVCPSLLTIWDAAISGYYTWVSQNAHADDVLSLMYIGWMWFSQAVVRPLATLYRRHRRHNSDTFRILKYRWLTLFFLLLFQVSWAFMFIAPGVSTISTSLCNCPVVIVENLIRWDWPQLPVKSCSADIRDLLCFCGVFAYFICSFLSLTLMAHVTYMLLSVFCGYIVGIKKKLGGSKTWRNVQDAVQQIGHGSRPDLGLYCNFDPPADAADQHEAERVGAKQQRWLYKSMIRHMHERDLISMDHCKAYCSGDFSQPPPEEALIHILQFLNGHAGLKSDFPEKVMNERFKKSFKQLKECVSIHRMRSLSVMVPYGKETVLFSAKELRDGLLRHIACLWPAEWNFFCERTFFGGADPQGVLKAFESGNLYKTWIQCRDQYEDECFKCVENAQRKKWGMYWWRLDPPPPSPVDDPELIEVVQRLHKTRPVVHVADAEEAPPDLRRSSQDLMSWPVGASAASCALPERRPAERRPAERRPSHVAGGAAAHGIVSPRHHHLGPIAAATAAGVPAARDAPGSYPLGPLPMRASDGLGLRTTAHGVPSMRTAFSYIGDSAEVDGCIEPIISREGRKRIYSLSKVSHEVRDMLSKHRTNVQYWIELQVRLWASLRGQTLARLAYGLHDMREAVCDMAYLAYKNESMADACMPEDRVQLTERSTVLDVCAWVHQGARDCGKRWVLETTDAESGVPVVEDGWVLLDSVKEDDPEDNNKSTRASRTADLLVYACRYWRLNGKALLRAVQEDSADDGMRESGVSGRPVTRCGFGGDVHKSFRGMLEDQRFQAEAAAWCVPWFPSEEPEARAGLDPDDSSSEDPPTQSQSPRRARAHAFVEEVYKVLPGLVRAALGAAERQGDLHERAERLVSTKIQFCLGAQAYWVDQVVRRGTDELLRMDRLRHLELVTDRSFKGEVKVGWGAGVVRAMHDCEQHATVHIMRKAAATSRVNFLRAFGPPEWFSADGKEPALGNADGRTYMRKQEERLFTFTMFHRQSRLLLGEPKAENQNNIIVCARGEVLQMLDMNQDAYYAEGIKLPLVLQLWDKKFRGSDEKGRKRIAAAADNPAENASQDSPDSYHMLGFREHIFTQSHSAVGRYMALAEFSFVTLIQRFLANPHEVRLHYGHPDMVMAAHMRQTGGVSRSSFAVNVNEDIFLGYEMAATGKDVAMIEYISYGKGREVEFNGASRFLKKLSSGAVMQLGSRQVYSLYTKGLWTPQKWALFYGSLAHFINIYLMDFTIFLFTYVLMIFALAELTPQNFRLLESPLADPWLIQIGMFYILPMVVERNLEKSYLHASDFVMSIPFFAHQNRITASYFGSTMHTGQGKYMSTGRGMGNKRTPIVAAFIHHTATNFIPGLRLLLCAAIYYWAGYGCSDCRTSDSDLFRLWIVLISAFSYLTAPSLYNAKPTFSAVWQEWADTVAWISEDVGPLQRRRRCPQGQVQPDQPFGGSGSPQRGAHFPTAESWMGKAETSDGVEWSMRTFWVYGWLDYLNSNGLNAAGSAFCPEAFAVFVRELVMIASKYGLWAVVPLVAFTSSRGDAVTETAPDGTEFTKQPPRMSEFSWEMFAFLVLDITVFMMRECFSPITHKLSVASRAEFCPRVIRLAILPLLYIIILAIVFLVTGRSLGEALAKFFFYIVFGGIAFAAATELALALAQLWVNLSDRLFGVPDSSRPKNSKGQKQPETDAVTDPNAKARREWRENCRLDVLLWMARWNPIILFYQRMYLIVCLCLLVPNALLAAIARLHTTWLFTENVARHDAGKD